MGCYTSRHLYGKWKTFEPMPLPGGSLLDEMSKIPSASLWEDETGKMWVGTTRGVWCYDDQKNHWSITV